MPHHRSSFLALWTVFNIDIFIFTLHLSPLDLLWEVITFLRLFDFYLYFFILCFMAKFLNMSNEHLIFYTTLTPTPSTWTTVIKQRMLPWGREGDRMHCFLMLTVWHVVAVIVPTLEDVWGVMEERQYTCSIKNISKQRPVFRFLSFRSLAGCCQSWLRTSLSFLVSSHSVP
jgi:hypothetical protein